MEENVNVGEGDSSEANVGHILTSLLRFQLVSFPTVCFFLGLTWPVTFDQGVYHLQ